MARRPKRHTIGTAAPRTEEQLSTEIGALHQGLPCVWVRLQERKRSAARLANKRESKSPILLLEFMQRSRTHAELREQSARER